MKGDGEGEEELETDECVCGEGGGLFPDEWGGCSLITR